MDIKTYLAYKAYCLKEYLKGSFGRVKFWWEFYLGLFFGLLFLQALTIIYEMPDKPYIWLAVGSLAVLIFLSVLKDYQSGDHRNWQRRNYVKGP